MTIRTVFNHNPGPLPDYSSLGYTPTLQVIAPDNEDGTIEIHSFGSNTSAFVTIHSPGSAAVPLATTTGPSSYLGYFSARGWVGSPAVQARTSGTMAFYPLENFTPGHLGTGWTLSLIPRGSSTPQTRIYVDELEAEFYQPVNAPSYSVSDVPGQSTVLAAGGKTLTFTNGILTNVV